MVWQLWGLIGFILIGAIVVSLLLNKIKLLIQLSLFKTSHSAFGVTYFLTHEVNRIQDTIQQGPQIDYFPSVIGVVILCFAVLSLYINKFIAKSPNRPIKFRWHWFISALLICVTGFSFVVAALYTPVLFGYPRMPLPKMAFWIWILSITIASPMFYKVSRMNDDACPNRMRIIVFFVVAFFAMETVAISMIMNYAILGNKVSYVFWGAIITLGLLPPSLVILGIAKDYLPLPPNNSEG